MSDYNNQNCQEAVDRAVKKVFAILGVDIDKPEFVEEFREGWHFGKRIRKVADRGFLAIIAALLPAAVFAQDTTINYKGQPPPTAMAPSVNAMGNDICAIPISGAISSTVIGVAGGTAITDRNCELIKLARELSNQQLKVAAVALLCQDERVWKAMEMSGSACPIGGAIGDVARLAWFQRNPKPFRELYGEDWNPPAVAHPVPDNK